MDHGSCREGANQSRRSKRPGWIAWGRPKTELPPKDRLGIIINPDELPVRTIDTDLPTRAGDERGMVGMVLSVRSGPGKEGGTDEGDQGSE